MPPRSMLSQPDDDALPPIACSRPIRMAQTKKRWASTVKTIEHSQCVHVLSLAAAFACDVEL